LFVLLFLFVTFLGPRAKTRAYASPLKGQRHLIFLTLIFTCAFANLPFACLFLIYSWICFYSYKNKKCKANVQRRRKTRSVTFKGSKNKQR